jgi:uncharacterized membrane protein
VTTVLLGAFVLGIVAGLRTFTAPAALYLARGGVAGYVLAVLALGELVGDMLPKIPPRDSPPALAGRVVAGGFTGWMLCVFLGGTPVAGAVAGVAGALAGTYGGKAFRLALIAGMGPVPAALVEDVLAIVLAILAVTMISPVPL